MASRTSMKVHRRTNISCLISLPVLRQPVQRQIIAKAGIVEAIEQKNAENPVVVYSKSYCPYCARAKGLLADLGVEAKVVELDNIVEGADIQDALRGITGSSTVPQVFIAGQFIGGSSETFALHDKGKLLPLLDSAGIVHK